MKKHIMLGFLASFSIVLLIINISEYVITDYKVLEAFDVLFVIATISTAVILFALKDKLRSNRMKALSKGIRFGVILALISNLVISIMLYGNCI